MRKGKMRMTIRSSDTEPREVTVPWLSLQSVEECLELNNRFCLRCFRYSLSPRLEFSLKLRRKSWL